MQYLTTIVDQGYFPLALGYIFFFLILKHHKNVRNVHIHGAPHLTKFTDLNINFKPLSSQKKLSSS